MKNSYYFPILQYPAAPERTALGSLAKQCKQSRLAALCAMFAEEAPIVAPQR